MAAMRVLEVTYLSKIDSQVRRAQFDVTGKSDDTARIYANTKTRDLREPGTKIADKDYRFFEVEKTQLLFTEGRPWTK